MNRLRKEDDDENSVPHGAAGRAASEIKVVHRGPVNGAFRYLWQSQLMSKRRRWILIAVLLIAVLGAAVPLGVHLYWKHTEWKALDGIAPRIWRELDSGGLSAGCRLETVVATYPPTHSGEFGSFTVLVYSGAQMSFYLPTNDPEDLAGPADYSIPMTQVTIVAKDGSLAYAILEHFRWDEPRVFFDTMTDEDRTILEEAMGNSRTTPDT